MLLGATMYKQEMQVAYDRVGGKMTDYVMRWNGTELAVSVTRAMQWQGKPLTIERAQELLQKKLLGIELSTANTQDFRHQFLHVWVRNRRDALTLYTAFKTLHWTIRKNHIIICNISRRAHWILRENPLQ